MTKPPGGDGSPPPDPRAPAPTAAPTPAALTDDPSLPELPERYDERALRGAAGDAPGAQRPASTERDRDDEPPRRWTWRRVAIAAAAGAVAVAAGVLAIAGQINRDRYVLTCEAERAVPEQGRGFPPWGTRAMAGEPWRPLAITRETRCRPLDTDDVLVLERAYLAMIVERAAALLTAHEVTKLDEVEALLQQALVLGRPPVAEPDSLARQRSEQRELTERMLGDVAYGRAAAKLRDAAAALGEAARLYERANGQRPRYVSDAAAASAYVRALARELNTGQLAATIAASAPGGPRGTAPAGAAAAGGAPSTAHTASSTSTASTGSGSTAAGSSAAQPTTVTGPGSAAATNTAAAPNTVAAAGSAGSAAATSSAAPNTAAAPSTAATPNTVAAAGGPTSGSAPATNGSAAPSTVAAAGSNGGGSAPATNGAAASGAVAAPDRTAAPSRGTGPASAAAPGTVATPGSASDRASGTPPPMAERPVVPSRDGATGESDRAQAAPPDAGVSTGGILL